MVHYSAAPAAERAIAELSETLSPPLTPAIDVGHLARMTMGERDLEREVLQLFDLQAATLLPRMVGGTPKTVAVLAHTLNGSARGIGAWKVSQAAEALERAATGPAPDISGDAIGRLSAAVAEAHMAISELLHAA
jgi:hypothetical protein